MGRTYAGILGIVAFVTALIRGWLGAAASEQALWTAWICLIAFSVVGFVIGSIAQATVDESVRAQAAAALAAEETATPQAAETPA